MSDALAISVVTSAVSRRVFSAASAAVGDADVRLGPPTAKLAEDNESLVNIHLYRVEPNAAHANEHLPSRSGRAQDLGPAQLALDLHYIFSFYGDAKKFVPERMLANVMLALEKIPLLTKSAIDGAIANNTELTGADLGDAVSRVHLSRELMSIDDFSKIWSIFYQVPYTLSIAYRASHVIIQTEDVAKLAMPIARRDVWVAPFAGLRLDNISGTSGPTAQVIWGNDIRIMGTGFGQPGIGLTLDGVTFDLTDVAHSDDEIVIALEAARLGGQEFPVGVHALRVLAPDIDGRPSHLRGGSNSLSFAITPAITVSGVTASGGGGARNGTVSLTITPAVKEDQNAVLLLDSRDPLKPAQFRIEAKRTGVTFPASALDFPYTQLPLGSYLARLDVDGFVSPVALATDPNLANFGEIVGPLVTIA
jgi:Pvc16 N-terminal domain